MTKIKKKRFCVTMTPSTIADVKRQAKLYHMTYGDLLTYDHLHTRAPRRNYGDENQYKQYLKGLNVLDVKSNALVAYEQRLLYHLDYANYLLAVAVKRGDKKTVTAYAKYVAQITEWLKKMLGVKDANSGRPMIQAELVQLNRQTQVLIKFFRNNVLKDRRRDREQIKKEAKV